MLSGELRREKLKLMDVSHLRNIFAFHPTSRETQQQRKFRHVIFFIRVAWEVAADIHPTWDSHYTEVSLCFGFMQILMSHKMRRESCYLRLSVHQKRRKTFSVENFFWCQQCIAIDCVTVGSFRRSFSSSFRKMLKLIPFLGLSCLCWRCEVSRRCITLSESS